MQDGLFGAEYERKSRLLPLLDEQSDISYYAAPAKNVLNGPETTGMDFWSLNPYTGCAFGCTYCYARYAHRYVMERASDARRMEDPLAEKYEKMPPWLAFERNIFVKTNAPQLLARALRQGSDKHQQLVNGTALLIGSATDPYQPAERRFRVTRGVLEVLATHPGLGRMYKDKHWASDVLMGAVLGEVVGRAVVRWHHTRPGNRLDRAMLGVTATVDPAGRPALAWSRSF